MKMYNICRRECSKCTVEPGLTRRWYACLEGLPPDMQFSWYDICDLDFFHACLLLALQAFTAMG